MDFSDDWRGNMQQIIIVEDDQIIREELQIFLSKYGYEIKAPTEFDNIVDYILKQNADLILLDINLPVFDGYFICREIRKTSEVPIIVVTSRDSEVDELMSMNLGADDFVTKPYNTQILLARIAALLKRSGMNSNSNSILTYKDFKLNLSNATVIYNDKNIELTLKEFNILKTLIEKYPQVITRESLLDSIWGYDYYGDTRIVGAHIKNLRKKISLPYIKTVKGIGYTLEKDIENLE